MVNGGEIAVDTLLEPERRGARVLDRDLRCRGLSSGRAVKALQLRRRIHGRSRSSASFNRKTLAPQEPSIHGSSPMATPHSDACFVRAYRAATAEAWMDGPVHAFAFFGGVPQSVLYDNDRCLVSKILADGTRRRATLFSALQSHYLFRDRYGRPGKGNE